MGSNVFDHSAESGAVVGSGVPASETRNLPPFDGIELAGNNNVAIRLGGEQSVVVHAEAGPTHVKRRSTASATSRPHSRFFSHG
jgi:hypothetical protein